MDSVGYGDQVQEQVRNADTKNVAACEFRDHSHALVLVFRIQGLLISGGSTSQMKGILKRSGVVSAFRDPRRSSISIADLLDPSAYDVILSNPKLLQNLTVFGTKKLEVYSWT